MTVNIITDVEFGEELPAFVPDTTMTNVKRFAVAADWDSPRFTDHEAAKKQGLPGALVPGIMSQGFLSAMIHNWAPPAEVRLVDTVFRAPCVVDQTYNINGVVTDIDEDTGEVEVDLTVTNEAGETRVFGTAKVLIPTG
jgi:acyl dehydratase